MAKIIFADMASIESSSTKAQFGPCWGNGWQFYIGYRYGQSNYGAILMFKYSGSIKLCCNDNGNWTAKDL